MNNNREMEDPKKGMDTENPKSNETAQNVGNTPKKFHIVITDPDSGKVLLDSTTDIAIIGAVDRDKAVGETVPSTILWVGNSSQMEQMLGLIATVIGSTIYQDQKFPGTMTVGKKASDLKN